MQIYANRPTNLDSSDPRALVLYKQGSNTVNQELLVCGLPPSRGSNLCAKWHVCVFLERVPSIQ